MRKTDAVTSGAFACRDAREALSPIYWASENRLSESLSKSYRCSYDIRQRSDLLCEVEPFGSRDILLPISHLGQCSLWLIFCNQCESFLSARRWGIGSEAKLRGRVRHSSELSAAFREIVGIEQRSHHSIYTIYTLFESVQVRDVLQQSWTHISLRGPTPSIQAHAWRRNWSTIQCDLSLIPRHINSLFGVLAT